MSQEKKVFSQEEKEKSWNSFGEAYKRAYPNKNAGAEWNSIKIKWLGGNVTKSKLKRTALKDLPNGFFDNINERILEMDMVVQGEYIFILHIFSNINALYII